VKDIPVFFLPEILSPNKQVIGFLINRIEYDTTPPIGYPESEKCQFQDWQNGEE